VIELDKNGYQRLYAQVLLIAMRLTHTKDQSQQASQVDRAREATQRAFERYLRVRPANLDTPEKLRSYLVWRVRSEMSHAQEEQAVRREYEAAAAIEQATVGGRAGPSAEVVHIEHAAAERRRDRAKRAIPRLRTELAEDPIALGTIDCLKKGKTRPAQQALILGCSVEEIYAARRRRKRALKNVLAAIDAEDEKKEMV
jgi:hypothetical protein